MMQISVVTSFSDGPDGGNPAGVVVEASGLSETQMKAIATQAGFSETAFIFPSKQADFNIRFFTPTGEVDLCGHATIATFHLLSEQGRVSSGHYTQETKAGVLKIEIRPDGAIFMEQAAPVFSEVVDWSLISASLHLSVNDQHPYLKPQIVSTGLRDVIIPVKNIQTLFAIQPDFTAVSEISETLDVVGYHLFCLETLHDGNAHCRNLAPLYGIPEEAATGTANGALSAYLFHHQQIDKAHAGKLLFEQGYCMNRPSEIQASLVIENNRIDEVKVGGRACTVDSIELKL